MILLSCIISYGIKEVLPMKKRILSLALAVLMAFSALFVGGNIVVTTAPEASAEETGKWIAAWGTGLTDVSFEQYDNVSVIAGKVSVRIVLTPTASGTKVRFKLSNKYGKNPLKINRATVAKSSGGSTIDTKSVQRLYYNGEKTNFVIPAGKEIYTDPVDFPVTAHENIALSIYISEYQAFTTVGLSGAKSYLSFKNNTSNENADFNFPLSYSSISAVPIAGSMDVYSEEPDPYSVVVIGDSTVSNNVPLYLARRIAGENCTNVGVVGKGIFGNSLTTDGEGLIGNIYGPSVLNRMEKDVLEQAGVRYAIIKIGANDITHPESASIKDYGNYVQPTADDMIAAFEKFIDTCHDNNIKVIACSITQWKGATRNYFDKGGDENEYDWKEEDWQIACDVNDWLSTTKKLDGFVDLNEISQDPNDPAAFRADYTSDYIHPNDTLQQIWANEIPLKYIGMKIMPKSIKLSDTSLSLAVGKTYQLQETVKPSNASNKSVKWISSNPKIATVDGNGVVKGIANGTATITCQSVNNVTATCKVNVRTYSTSVKLNKTSLSLYTTQKATLKATVSPSSTSDKSVKWSSSDTSVATVSSSGVVTAVGKGKATITCKTADSGKKATCQVNVTKKIAVNGLSLNKSSKTVYKGKTYQLKANITPSNASIKTVTWKSSDTSVATVTSSGLVTAKGNGTAKIICTSKDGKYTATCKITVKTKVTGVSLNVNKTNLYVGGTKQLTATVTPKSASNKDVTWKSSDKAVATVNSSGKVTAKATGTAVISCTTKDGSYKASCTVTVKKLVKAKSVKLNKTSKTLYVTDNYTLKATVSPSNASNKGVKWKSSNKNVATVNSSGKVTAVGKGIATITCTTKDGGYTATCKITVKKINVTGLSISEESLEIDVGQSERIFADIRPSDASNQNVTWKSSDKSVATVSSTGKVTGVGVGDVKITCTTKDGGYQKTCKVTVKYTDPTLNQKVLGVKLDKANIAIKKGSTYTLHAKIVPADAWNRKVKWVSSDTSVATVEDGVVKAVGKGTAIVSVVTDDGGWKSSCTVQVS